MSAEPWSYRKTVYCNLRSKANSRRVTRWGGVIKSEAAMQFVADFAAQVPRLPDEKTFLGRVILFAHVYYNSDRPDLDVSLLQDVLQRNKPGTYGANIIKNDRQIRKFCACKDIDKENPRIYFKLEEIRK